ncbi:helix-turn-helix domain-containing protein [Pseudonocardia sp. CA-107938]|uniref:TetR/AcrR family transcriptional regulator n=1 Tax=Pseudonocardia sp. CA-107938 TaxID=3240021 RepID=UPI003D94403A
MRDVIVAAAKALLWERGVAATSPAALLAAAEVGQGSLYHHFRSKQQWALAAIEALAADLDAETAAVLDDPSASGLARILAYLEHPRAARAGCRLGRLAFDPQVAADPTLSAPISDYFARTRAALAAAARDAVAAGELRADPDDLAAALVAVVQGGFVLARAADDDSAMTAATRATAALVRAARLTEESR